MESVAFLVPMYQSEATIEACLASIATQTHRHFEAIIVDDGSSDGGPAIVKAFTKKDPRFKLHQMTHNAGLVRALNEGLRHSRADLIARLDADDEADPRRLAVQTEVMEADPEIVLCGSFATHMGRNRAYDRISPVPIQDADIRRMLNDTLHSPFYHPTVMIRRTALTRTGGYRDFFKAAEDHDLWFRLSTLGKMYNIPEPLVRYRINVSGFSIKNAWNCRIYSLVAKVSHEQPTRSLEDILRVVRESFTDDQRATALRSDFRYYVGELLRLGRFNEAIALISQSLDSIGFRHTIRIAIAESLAYLISRQ